MLIVTADQLFGEALEVALRYGGFIPTLHTALPKSLQPGDRLIVDWDALPPSARTRLPASAITFSKDAAAGADLIRPFPFRRLIALAKERFPQSVPLNASAQAPFFLLTPDKVLLQGKEISLSPAEHTLLTMLAEANGECVPTRQIDALWQEQGSNTTAVYIGYLRKKLDNACGLRLIRTVRGKGYCLCLPM